MRVLYNNKVYKSDEEAHFAEWLDEAVEAGLVLHWEYEPQTFELVPKQFHPITKKVVFQNHKYTPDFVVVFTNKGAVAFPEWMKYEPVACEATMDVKGKGDPYRKNGLFQANRKMMFEKYDIYVEKVVVANEFWIKTWLPASMWLTKVKKQPTTISKKCLTCEQFCARVRGVQGELL